MSKWWDMFDTVLRLLVWLVGLSLLVTAIYERFTGQPYFETAVLGFLSILMAKRESDNG